MFVDVFMMKDRINPFKSPSEKGGGIDELACEASE
jgi:hypothetical protein